MPSHSHPALPDPGFWTVAEVAALARVSKMTVYRLAKAGALDNIRVGRSIRIRGTAVTEYFGLDAALSQDRP
jgi:excisionase family DNA binding protein